MSMYLRIDRLLDRKSYKNVLVKWIADSVRFSLDRDVFEIPGVAPALGGE